MNGGGVRTVKALIFPTACFNSPFLPERDYVMFGFFAVAIPSVVRRLSVMLVHHTQGVEAFGKIFHRCVRWPSSDLRAKFYGDSPRGTLPRER